MEYAIEVGRRQRKRQAVHQTLLDAAQQLFDEQGVAGTTVEDIAQAADVARTTVFNHFHTKEAIALELASETCGLVAEQSQALMESGMPAVDVLRSAARSFLAAAIDQGEVAVAVARELLHPDRERATRAGQLVPVRQIVEAILLAAREEGSVRDDMPIDIVAERFTALLVQLLAQVMTCEAGRLDESLAVCLDILFNGITERSS